MVDNDLVGLLGIYAMRDIGFCREYKKQPPEKSQCHLDKDCFIVRNSYTADKHFVYLLYFYLITLLT